MRADDKSLLHSALLADRTRKHESAERKTKSGAAFQSFEERTYTWGLDIATHVCTSVSARFSNERPVTIRPIRFKETPEQGLSWTNMPASRYSPTRATKPHQDRLNIIQDMPERSKMGTT